MRAGQGHYKVGISNNVTKRMQSLQTANGNRIQLVLDRQVSDAHGIEKQLHSALANMKLDGGREWFELTAEQVIELAITINSFPTINVQDFEQIAQRLEQQAELNQSLSRQNRLKLISNGDGGVPLGDNDLKLQAINIFRDEGKASTSLLQRRLRIGYGKAARIVELLEQERLVSPGDGNRPRLVLN